MWGGGAANKNDGKFLGFAPREQGVRGRGAVRRFVQNAFEQSYIIPPEETSEETAESRGFCEAKIALLCLDSPFVFAAKSHRALIRILKSSNQNLNAFSTLARVLKKTTSKL